MAVNNKKLPMVMFMKRKSIRVYPNGIKVGVYYNPDLDQYFAISTRGQSVMSSEEINEEQLQTLWESEEE